MNTFLRIPIQTLTLTTIATTYNIGVPAIAAGKLAIASDLPLFACLFLIPSFMISIFNHFALLAFSKLRILENSLSKFAVPV